MQRQARGARFQGPGQGRWTLPGGMQPGLLCAVCSAVLGVLCCLCPLPCPATCEGPAPGDASQHSPTDLPITCKRQQSQLTSLRLWCVSGRKLCFLASAGLELITVGARPGIATMLEKS